MKEKHRGASSPARAKRKRGTRPIQLPETIGCALPAGTLDRIDRAAVDAGMVRAEWLRAAIRRALDLARKQRAG